MRTLKEEKRIFRPHALDKRPSEIKSYMRLLHHFDRCMSRRLQRYGLYRGQDVMLYILDEHGSLTQKDFVDCFEKSKATVASSLSRMEHNGLIERRTDPNDARCNRIYITDKGRQVVKDCKQDIEEVQNALFSDFSAIEKPMAEQMLIRMCQGIDRLESDENE